MLVRALLLATLAGSAVLAADVHAQDMAPLGLEARAGVAVPVGSFARLADPGLSLGATGTVRLFPYVGVYAAYDRDAFGSDDDARAGGLDVSDVVSSAGRVGIQWSIRGSRRVRPYLRTGVFLGRVSADFARDGDSERVTSDLMAALSLDAGADIVVGPSLSVVPGVRYYSLPPSFDVPGVNDPVSFQVRHLVFSLGLLLSR